MGIDGLEVLKEPNRPAIWHLAEKSSDGTLLNVCNDEPWTGAPQNMAVKLCGDCVRAGR